MFSGFFQKESGGIIKSVMISETVIRTKIAGCLSMILNITFIAQIFIRSKGFVNETSTKIAWTQTPGSLDDSLPGRTVRSCGYSGVLRQHH